MCAAAFRDLNTSLCAPVSCFSLLTSLNSSLFAPVIVFQPFKMPEHIFVCPCIVFQPFKMPEHISVSPCMVVQPFKMPELISVFPCMMFQLSEIPERLASTWNCSVPHWPRFQRHFRCNMRQECADENDESECPYSFCDHRGIRVDRHCYFYVENDVRISWFEARHECHLKGAKLASLSSLGKWNSVMTWLHWHPPRSEKSRYLAIGMTSTPPGLPFM